MHKRTLPIVLEVADFEDLSRGIFHAFARTHRFLSTKYKERWAMSSTA